MLNKIDKRHKQILDYLSKTPISTIASLSAQLGVSNETIRNDLKSLARKYDIIQTHGGVALRENNSGSYPFDYRMTINSRTKQIIGRTAAQLVEEDDVIFLESSTTSLALISALCQRDDVIESLVIVTTSFRIQSIINNQFKGVGGPRVFFVGGWVNNSQHSTSGEYTIEGLKHLHISKAFLSAAAIDDQLELMGYTESDSSVQQYMLQNAEQIIMLAESGKFPKFALIKVGSLLTVDGVVTDIKFSAEQTSRLKANHVTVIKATEE